MALLVRGARLVGPRAGGGRLLVQTFLPRHEVVQAALLADPGRLVEPERDRRRLLGLPPFAALAAVSGPGSDEVAAALRAVPGIGVGGARAQLHASAPPAGTSSAGPSSPPPARRAPACASPSTRPAPDPSVRCRPSACRGPSRSTHSDHATRRRVEGGPRGGGSPWPTPGGRSASPARSASAAASRRRGASGRRARPGRPASRRSSHAAAARAAPALPMRIGGFDQMTSKRTSAGTSSGAATTTLASPLAAAFAAHSARARSLTSTAHTVGAGGAAGERQRDRPGAAAEVEQRRPSAAAAGAGAQQERRAGVEASVAEHAAVGAQRERTCRAARRATVASAEPVAGDSSK